MTDEKIIEYVMDSPENTNPSVLDSMLKSNKVQPDWNQNDSTANDYIKNRPFYEETVWTVMLPETSFEVSGEGATLSQSFPYTFDIGKDYTVTLDGVTNTYTAVEYASGLGIITNTSIEEAMKGNGWLLGNVGNLQIMTQDTSFYGTHTISFSGEVTNTYKIAEKYTGISAKMDKTNPAGEGSFSLNRKADTDIGNYSFAEGYNTTASGMYSHAEGRGTTASSNNSHAEGYNTTASGDASHAEGYNTTASSNNSHAEGYNTTASGDASHAEGYNTTASSYNSHAEGYGTVAASRNQHAQGKWNVEDSNGVYAHIIGGGTDNTHRKNIHTVDWSGNAWYAGTVEGKALILTSSTAGSTKRFKVTVDDAGTLTATEVTT